MTRREAIWSLSTAATALNIAKAATPEIPAPVVERTDAAVDSFLKTQITEQGQWQGSVPDEYLMHPAGNASSLIENLTAAFLYPQSRHHNENEVFTRIRLAAGFLERSQSPEGFIDLLSTNFNSPPDTGFVVHNVGTAAAIAKLYSNNEVLAALRPFLTKAGNGLAVGGIHTPNHRWVVSCALAQINDVFPNPAYLRRINQWLAEGIDIDGDGQYTERSTVTYNTICDRAFTVLAAKLKRPQLLDPVRRNLRAMMYLRHPDGEVVTEVSKRQDQFVRGTMAAYWFPTQYLALHDNDGQFSTLARQLADNARLSILMEYPELNAPLPAGAPLPEDYEKWFPEVGLARIRRGTMDATIILQDSSRFFSARKGPLVVNAVRFATSFFGKGQYIPESTTHQGTAYKSVQSLDAPYYQPLDPVQAVNYKNYYVLRDQRRKTQICKLDQSATVEERPNGFALRLQSTGNTSGTTPIGVPLAVEINLREGGQLEGCRPAPHVEGGWILEKDYATYRVQGQTLRFGPGAAPHLLTQLRGAEPKLDGVSVYLTGYTPFDRTISFEFS